MKIGCSLSEVCPHANSVFGNLDLKKVSHILGYNYPICHVNLSYILNFIVFENFDIFERKRQNFRICINCSHSKFFLSKYLWTICYVPGTVLSMEYTLVNKIRVLVWNLRRHLCKCRVGTSEWVSASLNFVCWVPCLVKWEIDVCILIWN